MRLFVCMFVHYLHPRIAHPYYAGGAPTAWLSYQIWGDVAELVKRRENNKLHLCVRDSK